MAKLQNGRSTTVSRLRRLITVEPLLFCVMFTKSSLQAVQVQYVNRRIGEDYNYTTASSDQLNQSNCEINTSDPNYLLGQRVEAESSYWISYFEATYAGLAIFSAISLGSYSERGGGRKIPLLVSTFGYLFYTVSYLLVLNLQLPIQYFFIGEIIRGVTGSYPAVLATSVAVIADITEGKQRTFRIVLVETSMYMGSCVAELGTGYMIKSLGFIPPVWFTFGTMAFAVLYTIIWLQETSPARTSSLPRCNLRQQFTDVLHLFTESSAETNIEHVTLSVSMFLMLVIVGTSNSIIMLYQLGPPLCFTSVDIGLFQALHYGLSAIGLICGGKVLSLILGDLWMAQVGVISLIGIFLMIAFASTKATAISATAVGFLSSLQYPAIRSRLSKWFSPNQQGVVFAIQVCIQCIAYTLSPIIFNTVFSKTVDVMPILVFLVFAGVLLVVIMLLCSAQVREYRKRQKISFEPLVNEVVN